ncbi:MAG: hypothetical protein OEV44_00570 [Spirochaetota bacterium]|nr:hypothetical protein [Spirochaetota bacterium]
MSEEIFPQEKLVKFNENNDYNEIHSVVFDMIADNISDKIIIETLVKHRNFQEEQVIQIVNGIRDKSNAEIKKARSQKRTTKIITGVLFMIVGGIGLIISLYLIVSEVIKIEKIKGPFIYIFTSIFFAGLVQLVLGLLGKYRD